MIKVAVVTKSANNAVWWYRVLPWLYLGRQNRNIDVRVIHHQNLQAFEAMIGGFDVLVMHSPSNQRDYAAILKAREYGVNVLVDYDDLINGVPAWNGASAAYNHDEVQETVLECYKLANHITVSTSELANQFEQQLGKRPDVVNNAHNDFVLGAFPKTNNKPENGISTILWRGSETHAGDLMRYRDVIQDYENIDWHFWGAPPDLIVSKKWGGNLETWNHKLWEREVPRYFQNLRRLKPTYCFVPLYDDVFNRCKSGIAWLEATYAGAVCLASALPEFQHAHQFTTSVDLSNLLDLIDENGIDFSENYLNSVSEIQQNYLLSNVNRLRAEALDKVLGL